MNRLIFHNFLHKSHLSSLFSNFSQFALIFCHYLNFEIPLLSLIWAFFFSQLFKITISSPGVLCLFLATWLVYTVDHLLDSHTHFTSGFKISGGKKARHTFYQKYFTAFSSAILIGTLLGIYFALQLDQVTSISGLGLSIFCLLYLLCHHYFGKKIWMVFLKDLWVSLAFSAACGIPIISQMRDQIWVWVCSVAMLTIASLCGCILIGLIEAKTDAEEGQRTLFTVYPRMHALLPSLILVALTLSLLSAKGFDFAQAGQIAYATSLSLLLLFFLSLQKSRSRISLHRFAADAFLATPLLWILNWQLERLIH